MKKLLVLVLVLTASCQHPQSYVEKAKKVQSPLIAQERELNPHGSLFYAERTDDTYVENVGPVATFRFLARRFPPEGKYILGHQNLGSPIVPYASYEVDDDGQLGRQINMGTLMLDNEMFLMFDYCRGEPVDYWLCSTDGKTRLKATIVPYPITTVGRDGAVISIRRLTPDARLVLLEGVDFNPDEKILISSQSGEKRTHDVEVISVNGRFDMIFESAIDGKRGGTAYVDVERMGERLVISYDWGCLATDHKKRLGNTTKIKHDALLKLPTDV